MMVSALGLEALVLPALVLTGVAPFALIYLVMRDVKDKTLW